MYVAKKLENEPEESTYLERAYCILTVLEEEFKMVGHLRGPLGLDFIEHFDDGTLVRGLSPRPSPTGISSEVQKQFLKLEKGNYDDKAVAKYSSRKVDGAGYLAGTFVYKLQKDLAILGFGSESGADGDFGNKTLKQVKTFQSLAKTEHRIKNDKLVTTSISFKGEVNGKFDEHTKFELIVWLTKGYRIPLLTFPNTKFKYLPATLTATECIATLPSQLRSDFKTKISTVIKSMHKLGFAFGVWEKPKAGYRTFQQQADIDPTKTNAGPGESFHNYASAVDLGVLQWVDSTGKVHVKDFWLGGMDAMKQYKGLSAKVWAKRNKECPSGVYSLSFETIHLQSVPANSSGRSMLVKCLNQAAKDLNDTTWKYKKSANKTYQCNLGDGDNWKNVGTAKQLLALAATNSTADQKAKIKSHMIKAESIALTISLT